MDRGGDPFRFRPPEAEAAQANRIIGCDVLNRRADEVCLGATARCSARVAVPISTTPLDIRHINRRACIVCS